MKRTNPPLNELLSLKNKTALITGAAKGIGEATALRFAEAGADLFLLDIDKPALDTLADTIRSKYGVLVECFTVNLADPKAIRSFWDSLKKSPDIVINNAGIYSGQHFDVATDDFIAKTIQVNFGAVAEMCQQFIKRRKDVGGTIVNFGSIEAKSSFKKDMAFYAASKSAVMTLTRSLASEYSKKGFKINVIVPGAVRTPGTEKVAWDALRHLQLGVVATAVKFAGRLPIGRYAWPDDVARVVLFLASPMSDYMSGAEVAVDGGFLVA